MNKFKQNVQKSMPFFILKYSFSASNKSRKNIKQVSTKLNFVYLLINFVVNKILI